MMRFVLIAINICVVLQLGSSSSARTLQQQSKNASRWRRRELGEFSCVDTGNPIDDCWRCDEKWSENRQSYADCAIGFGKNAIGGKEGEIYVVTNTYDDPQEPQPGTLRHAVIQNEPLWIIFKDDIMSFSFKEELIMASYKTIDGRGNSKVEIVGPACITVQDVSNIIITNLEIRNCKPTGNAVVRSSTTHKGHRDMTDGDSVSIFGSRDVWVDHCSLSRCADGLIDAVEGSTDITVSNCYFTQHNEVMLLGHNDEYTTDKGMQVTIAFNHFGEGLVQRMPRCRHGMFHVIANVYTDWEMYAIGGSANPTILSQKNKFIANPNNPRTLEVTKRLNCETNSEESKTWNWMSDGDTMVNGAYFTPSGSSSIKDYAMVESLSIRQGSIDINALTADAGALNCYQGTACS